MVCSALNDYHQLATGKKGRTPPLLLLPLLLLLTLLLLLLLLPLLLLLLVAAWTIFAVGVGVGVAVTRRLKAARAVCGHRRCTWLMMLMLMSITDTGK